MIINQSIGRLAVIDESGHNRSMRNAIAEGYTTDIQRLKKVRICAQFFVSLSLIDLVVLVEIIEIVDIDSLCNSAQMLALIRWPEWRPY